MSWYDEWFDEEYVRVYGHRDVAEARRDVEFAQRVLGLQADQLILDLCCGNGRHLLALCEKGYKRLVGIDLSITLLRLARESLSGQYPQVRVLKSDMRYLPFRGCFDAVLNLFTSFGYFETDEENRSVLESMSRVLRPGGRFVLDYLNPEHVIATLQPNSERILNDRKVIEQRSIDAVNHRVNKSIEIHTPDGVKQYRESVRLYSHAEMVGMLSDSGLEVTAEYGDFDFCKYDSNSPRMIFVGEKKL